jgi:hypothetical protein
MGSGHFDPHLYSRFASSTHGRSTDDIYGQRHMHKNLDPLGMKIRESRDSPDNPQSTAIIVALDVTGSMGMLADTIARQGLGVLFNRLYDERPIADPHVMFMGVGDAHSDQAPLQVSQFEADNRIVEQLTQLWLEHGGGGNNSESYHLPWYFAAQHTSIDCFEKRGKKGYLFTVGDEQTPGKLLASQIRQFVGDRVERDLTPAELLAMARESYHVFHIIIEEGSYARSQLPQVRKAWRDLMGENALSLKDHTKLAEGIVSIIEMNEAAMGNGKSALRARELPSHVAALP